MDLKELVEKTNALFHCVTSAELGKSLLQCCLQNNTEMYAAFEALTGDLTTDWLQKIYQYYLADRDKKKQDFTPRSLAAFTARLLGQAEWVVDMCAGSGALTIQKWALHKDTKFDLHEADEQVIPFLIFNMALRNIECVLHHTDVLSCEVLKTYLVDKGEKYGTVREEP